MRENNASINNQSLKKQTRLLGTAKVSKKTRGDFVPEEKRDGGAMKKKEREKAKSFLRMDKS